MVNKVPLYFFLLAAVMFTAAWMTKTSTRKTYNMLGIMALSVSIVLHIMACHMSENAATINMNNGSTLTVLAKSEPVLVYITGENSYTYFVVDSSTPNTITADGNVQLSCMKLNGSEYISCEDNLVISRQ